MRDLLNLLPWRRLNSGETVAYHSSDPEFAARLREMVTVQDDEPSVGEIAARWSALYEQQTCVLENVTAALEAQTKIADVARVFMAVLAQRAAGGHPLFLINENGDPGDAETLRHAIVSLQAVLEGCEMPAMVAVGRVTH